MILWLFFDLLYTAGKALPMLLASAVFLPLGRTIRPHHAVPAVNALPILLDFLQRLRLLGQVEPVVRAPTAPSAPCAPHAHCSLLMPS